jgi:hypothetical protein
MGTGRSCVQPKCNMLQRLTVAYYTLLKLFGEDFCDYGMKQLIFLVRRFVCASILLIKKCAHESKIRHLVKGFIAGFRLQGQQVMTNNLLVGEV